MTTRTARIAATLEELNVSGSEYNEAKSSYDVARVKYEMAREKFAKTKELATIMLGAVEWMQWQSIHEDLRYVGSQLGDAITQTLRSYAYEMASTFDPKGKQEYQPALFLGSITQRLEDGGYDFRSSAPQREVNAALINLGGLLKTKFGAYQVAETGQILGFYQGAGAGILAQ